MKKILNRKYHKRCFEEKILRWASKGKITNPVLITVPRRFYNIVNNSISSLKKLNLEQEYNVTVLRVTFTNNIFLAEIINNNSLRVWIKPMRRERSLISILKI